MGVCGWCAMPLFAAGSYEIEEDGEWYCHNPDWVVAGGTCWEQRVVELCGVVEFSEWLEYGFECDGCEVDENGECTCWGWGQGSPSL